MITFLALMSAPAHAIEPADCAGSFISVCQGCTHATVQEVVDTYDVEPLCIELLHPFAEQPVDLETGRVVIVAEDGIVLEGDPAIYVSDEVEEAWIGSEDGGELHVHGYGASAEVWAGQVSLHNTKLDASFFGYPASALLVRGGEVYMEGGGVYHGDGFMVGGGAQVDAGAQLEMRDVHMDENWAPYGGHIFTEGILVLRNVRLDWGYGVAEGGAVLVASGGEATVRGSIVYGRASDKGGAFYVDDNAELLIVDTDVYGGGANFSGGAIYATGENSAVEVRYSRFFEPYAGAGSVFYGYQGGEASFVGSAMCAAEYDFSTSAVELYGMSGQVVVQNSVVQGDFGVAFSTTASELAVHQVSLLEQSRYPVDVGYAGSAELFSSVIDYTDDPGFLPVPYGLVEDECLHEYRDVIGQITEVELLAGSPLEGMGTNSLPCGREFRVNPVRSFPHESLVDTPNLLSDDPGLFGTRYDDLDFDLGRIPSLNLSGQFVEWDEDTDNDSWPLGADCDDDDPGRYPGAAEVCDGIDNDCDGRADNPTTDVFGSIRVYRDEDMDGLGDLARSRVVCPSNIPGGWVTDSSDCDDGDSTTHGPVPHVDDDDDDGHAAPDHGPPVSVCRAEGDGLVAVDDMLSSGDCVDSDENVHPDAAEVCGDGTDNDCDGTADEGVTWHRDGDGDNILAPGHDTQQACERPDEKGSAQWIEEDEATELGDCDDTDPSIGPPAVYVLDADSDGYAADAAPQAKFCPDDPLTVGYVELSSLAGDELDCNDDPAADGALQSPGLAEVCDGIDNNCNDVVDEGLGSSWVVDDDGDGYFPEGADVVDACDPPGAGWTLLDAAQPGDCDDSIADIHPAGVEICDEVDNDCDGDVDEGGDVHWVLDADGDGYLGEAPEERLQCAQPDSDGGRWYLEGGVPLGDCDDVRADVNPGAAEVCDGVDNDCDGWRDEGAEGDPDAVEVLRDNDRDGYGNEDAPAFLLCPNAEGDLPDDVAEVGGDCDDTDYYINPGAEELIGNQTDENCDGYYGESWVEGGGCSTTLGRGPGLVGSLLGVMLLGWRRRLT